MELIINNKQINREIREILTSIQSLTNGKYFSSIINRPGNVSTNCPFHKDGQERHPSFNIISDPDSKLPYGFYRCFTCGEQGPLYKLVAHCLNLSSDEAKEWLTDNFSDYLITRQVQLEPIVLGKFEWPPLDESILNNYRKYHPYLEDRGIPFEVAKYFNVGYDEETKEITFPVWDEHDKLRMISRRSVESKRFQLGAGTDKPVYLLNYIKKLNINEVTVCESQIDALTLWSWNIPAIALLGTGSKKQYDILKRSGIRSYHLALDGDDAGWRGITKFIKAMPIDLLIDIVAIPEGKDINDLTYEEFSKLNMIDKFSWNYH